MKFNKYFLIVPALIVGLAFLGRAQGPFPDNNYYHYMGLGVTNMAASTTNTTLGEIVSMANVRGPLGIYVNAQTYTNTGQVRVWFRTSPEGTNWVPPYNSLISLTMTCTNAAVNGVTTNGAWNWFNVPGGSKIQKAIIENQTGQPITNLNVTIVWPLDSNIQNR